MGKEKRARLHQSLAQQILEADAPRAKRRTKVREEKPEHDEFVGEKLTEKILHQARQQQEELEEEFGVGTSQRPVKRRRKKSNPGIKFSLGPAGDRGSDDEYSNASEGEDDAIEMQSYCPEVKEEDEKALHVFMNKNPAPRRTLADMIMEKIKDKETEIASQMSEAVTMASRMDEKVVAVFKGVGQILTKYRSGKLPKAFKVIPVLSNWEEVLYLTEPDKWSAAAMFQATRIFASNLNTAKSQHFYNLVLLPRVRDDISEYKRLNFHLYMALKKALYKPAAFFKGVLLPLCESGTCTLREALIIGSILAKNSIPMLHSSAALLKIAEMDYTGANSIFLRTLLEKKYALPFRAIDAVVFHFLGFKSDSRILPVLWHQSLLTFVQRYKEDLSVEQKEAILELLHFKTHRDITPEVRREIVNSRCRDLGVLFINKDKDISGASMQTN